MLIKLCKKYPNHKKLERQINVYYPDIEVKVKSCIGMCKSCKVEATAVVNKKKMKKKSIKKFMKALEEKISS